MLAAERLDGGSAMEGRCVNCGAAVRKGSTFCGACGAAVSPQSTSGPPPTMVAGPPPKKRGRIARIFTVIATVIILAVLAVGGYLGYAKLTKKTPFTTSKGAVNGHAAQAPRTSASNTTRQESVAEHAQDSAGNEPPLESASPGGKPVGPETVDTGLPGTLLTLGTYQGVVDAVTKPALVYAIDLPAGKKVDFALHTSNDKGSFPIPYPNWGVELIAPGATDLSSPKFHTIVDTSEPANWAGATKQDKLLTYVPAVSGRYYLRMFSREKREPNVPYTLTISNP